MPMIQDSATDDNLDQSISISGGGLLMDSQYFPLRTGPLFSFNCDGATDSRMEVESNLVESRLVNVSSSSSISPRNQLFGSEVSQRVVGSCVSCCTNHDSGTAMLSPNLGGNLMCLNTTFSSCIRQGNEDSEFSFENRTQGDRLDSIPASVASISFTLCTFNEMTVDADPFEGGAAILLSDTSSSVTVRTNFFHKCTSTGEYNFGGAICFIGASGRYPTLSISHSSFTECSTQFGWDVFSFGGGSIHVSAASTTIMTTCFFDQSTADSDGALFLATNFAEIANTVFADCSATNRGGAMSLERVNILNLSYLHFRGCSSVRDSRAKDINILGRSRLRSGKV